MMRLVKIALPILAVLVLIQVSRTYYQSQQFNDFIKREALHARTKKRLVEAILNKAGQFSLALNQQDISISTVGRVLRVEVNYSMPVDLLVYSPEMKFRLVRSGVLTE